MAFSPSQAYRGNLEKIGDDVQAGEWRITRLLDLVSEKRFLLSTLNSKGVASVVPSVLSYRGEAAASIAPEGCPEVLSVSIDGHRIEILTDFYEVATALDWTDQRFASVFQTLFKTLSQFDANGFRATDLHPGGIGIDTDGRVLLLPCAYILPAFFHKGSPSSEQGIWQSRIVHAHTQAGGDSLIHVALMARLIDRLFPSNETNKAEKIPPFVKRAQQASTGISDGSITTLADTYAVMFSETMPGFDTGVVPHPPLQTDADQTVLERIVNKASTKGAVTIIRGGPTTGKSATIQEATQRLGGLDDVLAVSLDEWDIFTRPRKNVILRATASHTVYVIDDIDDKSLACSDLSQAMAESADYPDGAVVLSVSTDASTETTAFLKKLRASRGEQYLEISLDPPSPEATEHYVSSIIHSLNEAATIEPKSTPVQAAKQLLASLTAEEKQLLEIAAVSRFGLPMDVVLSMFPEASKTICRAIHRLTSVEVFELWYRQLAKKTVSLFLRIRSSTLRRLIYDSIPAARRKKLHRTVSLLAEQQGIFPRFFLLYHSFEAGEIELAAKHFVGYLKETKSKTRHPFVLSFCSGLSQARLLESLSFSDRMLTHYELSLDLLKNNRAAEAERLLIEALELVDEADMEQKLKRAPLLSAAYRLLADQLEARGEFRKALDLLSTAKEELRSALSIPDQAQLLNDLGWLEYRLGEYDKSMESCRLSLNTLSANQYPLIVAQALNLMGVVHFNTSRYDEAISYYEQSAYLRERAGDENALAASFNNLALTYQSKNEYEKALDYYNKSLDLKKHQNNQSGIAAGYLNLALLYLEARNFKEAEAKCKESLAISEELGHAQLTADNYITLGDIAMEGGDLNVAEQHFLRSLEISHHIKAINEEMGALRRLSTICLKQKRISDSIDYADRAFALVERIGSKYESAQIEAILGDLEIEQEHPTEALKHYEKASTQYTALSKYHLAAKMLSRIGLIHADTGNTFEAKHVFDRAQDFIRADIGRDIPEEFAKLQQALRTQPSQTPTTVDASQKLLMAFYDLSALTDYAADRDEFLNKIMDVTRQIIEYQECFLALKAGRDRFFLYDGSAMQRPMIPKGFSTLFRRTLLTGGLLDSRSADAQDLLGDMRLPETTGFVCVPLKAMNEELGCFLFYIGKDRLPLLKEDINFFKWLGRQIGGSLKLMLHFNEDLVRDEDQEATGSTRASNAKDSHEFENLIGKSESMKKIFRMLDKIRDMDSGILILGESGTGKSALARAIHYNSPRKNRPFQEIHCAQIPHNLLESELFGHERGAFTGAVQRKVGLCELAGGGSLFLDDINVIPVETQTKLLNFIESKSFIRLGGTQRLSSDLRIIAASNEDLERLCKEGKFREDLYFRLKVILIDLPPLRERKEDMLAIALDYIEKSCAEKGVTRKTLSPETIELFQKAPWRGNVRELQNVLERIVVLSDENIISPASLPEDFLQEVTGTSGQAQHRLEELIDEVIKLGNYSESNPLLPLLEALLAKKMVEHVEGKHRAASMLGVSKPTLYARLRDYDRMH